MMRRLHTATQRVTRADASKGFTLIEVMLALAILATIIALTWGTVSSSFRFRRAALDKFDRYRTVQQAMDRMAREVSMAFVTNVGQTATNEAGEITYRTAFVGRDDELSFTSMAHVRTRTDEPASEQCEITYRIESQRGEDGDMHDNLIRREDAPIDDEPEEGGIKYTMLRDVERIRFEYWDPTREIADAAWVDQWDAINDHDGLLPTRVRITLEVQHPTLERETLEFVTETEVFLNAPLNVLPPDIAEALAAVADTLSGEICDNGVDDNGDGAIDCDDEACFDDDGCREREELLEEIGFEVGQ